MAKRGERFPFRVSFEWSNGVHGTKALGSVDLVDEFVRQIEDTARIRDLDLTLRVARPGWPIEVRHITNGEQLGACPLTGRSASACEDPVGHSTCPDLRPPAHR